MTGAATVAACLIAGRTDGRTDRWGTERPPHAHTHATATHAAARYTHVSACCNEGSHDNDTDYVCPAPSSSAAEEDYRAWDWFNATAAGSCVVVFVVLRIN